MSESKRKSIKNVSSSSTSHRQLSKLEEETKKRSQQILDARKEHGESKDMLIELEAEEKVNEKMKIKKLKIGGTVDKNIEFEKNKSISFGHNLPSRDQYFIGRSNELIEIMHTLNDRKVVVVSGPGASSTIVELGYLAIDSNDYLNNIFWINGSSVRDLTFSLIRLAIHLKVKFPSSGFAFPSEPSTNTYSDYSINEFSYPILKRITKVLKNELDSWLLIIDDRYEFFHILSDLTSNSKHILISSRVRSYKRQSLYVLPPFTIDEASLLLWSLNHPNQSSSSITSRPPPSFIPLVSRLLELSRGHPVFIRFVADYCSRNRLSIGAFLQKYEKDPIPLLSLPGPVSYHSSSPIISSYSSILHKTMKESSAAYFILHALAFLCPNRIPLSIFKIFESIFPVSKVFLYLESHSLITFDNPYVTAEEKFAVTAASSAAEADHHPATFNETPITTTTTTTTTDESIPLSLSSKDDDTHININNNNNTSTTSIPTLPNSILSHPTTSPSPKYPSLFPSVVVGTESELEAATPLATSTRTTSTSPSTNVNANANANGNGRSSLSSTFASTSTSTSNTVVDKNQQSIDHLKDAFSSNRAPYASYHPLSTGDFQDSSGNLIISKLTISISPILQHTIRYNLTLSKVHNGIQCSSCGVTPISGTRYGCNLCDYDLCPTCFDSRASAHVHSNFSTFPSNFQSVCGKILQLMHTEWSKFRHDDPSTWETARELFPHVASITRFALDSMIDLHRLAHLLGLGGIGGFESEVNANYSKALEYFKTSSQLYLQCFGAEHRSYLTSLNNIGLLHRDLGHYTKSLAILQNTLEILSRIHGDHPKTAGLKSRVASLLRVLGRYSESLELYSQACEERRKHLGDTSPSLATTLTGIGLLIMKMGNYKLAMSYFQESLAIRATQLGDKSIRYAMTLTAIGRCLSHLSEHDSALNHIDSALRIYAEVLDPGHPDLSVCRIHKVRLLHRAGHLQDALKLLESAEANLLPKLGAHHPEIAHLYSEKASLYVDLGVHLDQAHLLLDKSIAVRTESFPASPPHPELVADHQVLAKLYQRTGNNEKAVEVYQLLLSLLSQRFEIDPQTRAQAEVVQFKLTNLTQNAHRRIPEPTVLDEKNTQ